MSLRIFRKAAETFEEEKNQPFDLLIMKKPECVECDRGSGMIIAYDGLTSKTAYLNIL